MVKLIPLSSDFVRLTIGARYVAGRPASCVTHSRQFVRETPFMALTRNTHTFNLIAPSSMIWLLGALAVLQLIYSSRTENKPMHLFCKRNVGKTDETCASRTSRHATKGKSKNGSQRKGHTAAANRAANGQDVNANYIL